MFLSSRFQQVTCDWQGRVTLPEQTVRIAGLKGDVVLTGSGYWFTIWAPAS